MPRPVIDKSSISAGMSIGNGFSAFITSHFYSLYATVIKKNNN